MIVGGKYPHLQQIKTALKNSGVEVVSVSNTSEGQEFLDSKDHVDLILSEAFLENDDVFELLRLVRHDPAQNEVPMLIFADEPSNVGQGSIDSISTAANLLGAHAFIHMPEFSLPQLMNEIEAILARCGAPRKQADIENAY